MFARPLFLCMGTNNPSLRIFYSYGYGRIARVCKTGIPLYADDLPVFALMLSVRIRTNRPYLRVRNSCVWGGTALVCVFAMLSYADE